MIKPKFKIGQQLEYVNAGHKTLGYTTPIEKITNDRYIFDNNNYLKIEDQDIMMLAVNSIDSILDQIRREIGL